MMFCGNHISEYLNKTSMQKLMSVFDQKYKAVFGVVSELDEILGHGFAYDAASRLMSFRHCVFYEGEKLFWDAFKIFVAGGGSMSIYELLIKAKYDYQMWACSGNTRAFDMMMIGFSACIVSSPSLYPAVISLTSLSHICKKLGQYVVALRLLDKAYECCTMYEPHVFPSFVKGSYRKKRKRIKQKLKEMRCSHCGRNAKLLCCVGCMSAFYCSKSCQKRHWKHSHRDDCDKRWLEKLNKDMLKQIL